METEAENVNQLLINCIQFEKSRLQTLKTNKKVNEDKTEIALKHKILEKWKNTTMLSQGVPINVRLYIEKASESRGPFSFSCYPYWTIYTVKTVLNERFNFSIQCQNIIINHAVAKDYKTLHNCGIDQQNGVLYVYISKKKQVTNEPILPSLEDLTMDVESSQKKNDNKVNGQVNTEVSTVDIAIQKQIEGPINADENESAVAENFTHYSLPLLENDIKDGWVCTKCTTLNEPTRPGCIMCSEPRPQNYQLPRNYIPSAAENLRLHEEKMADDALKLRQQKREEKRIKKYEEHQSALENSIVLSPNSMDCKICLNTIKPCEGIQLKECLHAFCLNCIRQHAILSSDAMVKCPYIDDDYACQYFVQECEIRELLNPEEYRKYLDKGLSLAEKQMPDSYHCATPDCKGWCLYDDGVNSFACPVCDAVNCLTCKAIHENMNCTQFQNDLDDRALTDEDAKRTNKMLKDMLSSDNAMHCPQCNIIIVRKNGCDWVRCTMCKLEICWVTKGSRWGPNGKNDISGGCRCRVNNKKCHPDCVNCH